MFTGPTTCARNFFPAPVRFIIVPKLGDCTAPRLSAVGWREYYIIIIIIITKKYSEEWVTPRTRSNVPIARTCVRDEHIDEQSIMWYVYYILINIITDRRSTVWVVVRCIKCTIKIS